MILVYILICLCIQVLKTDGGKVRIKKSPMPPSVFCSATYCEIICMVEADFDELSTDWNHIFKNGTPVDILTWKGHSKYTADTRTNGTCIPQPGIFCTFSIVLRIKNPDPLTDYGRYQGVFGKSQYGKVTVDFTVPSSNALPCPSRRPLEISESSTKETGKKSSSPSISIEDLQNNWLYIVSGAVGTLLIVFIVVFVAKLRKRGNGRGNHHKRNRANMPAEVSTHLYDEIDSQAYGDTDRKASLHPYIRPLTEDSSEYRDPVVFSNTRIPGRNNSTNTSRKDSMGYLQPEESIKYKPTLAISNEIYHEKDRSKQKKALEPTYSNSAEVVQSSSLRGEREEYHSTKNPVTKTYSNTFQTPNISKNRVSKSKSDGSGDGGKSYMNAENVKKHGPIVYRKP